MFQVAEKLREIADTSKVPDDFDSFGRSSFNRYYYATYLTVRDMLSTLNPVWAKTSHASIPNLLLDSVRARIKKEAIRQQKNGLIGAHVASSHITEASSSLSVIAEILTTAYGVRVVADYEPSQRVAAGKSGFSLNTHTASEAREWKTRAEAAKGNVLRIARELAIV